jgi:hypothetical protein
LDKKGDTIPGTVAIQVLQSQLKNIHDKCNKSETSLPALITLFEHTHPCVANCKLMIKTSDGSFKHTLKTQFASFLKPLNSSTTTG